MRAHEHGPGCPRGLLGEHYPLQLELDGLDLAGWARRGNGLQQALGRVQGPQGVVRGERVLVRPLGP
jgi:hypothetical protein